MRGDLKRVRDRVVSVLLEQASAQEPLCDVDYDCFEPLEWTAK